MSEHKRGAAASIDIDALLQDTWLQVISLRQPVQEPTKREIHGKSSHPVATSEPLLCPCDGRGGFALPDPRPRGNFAGALAAETAGAGRGRSHGTGAAL